MILDAGVVVPDRSEMVNTDFLLTGMWEVRGRPRTGRDAAENGVPHLCPQGGLRQDLNQAHASPEGEQAGMETRRHRHVRDGR